MKYIILSSLLFIYSCSTVQKKHNNGDVKPIEHTSWTFNRESIDLFSSMDAPLSKDYEFYDTFSKLLTDSVEIKPIHQALLEGKFEIRFLSDNICRLIWSRTIPHVVTGKAVVSFTMECKWETGKDDNISVSYEYLEFFPMSIGKGEYYVPSKYTHICRMKYRMQGNNLILTPIAIEPI